MLLPPFADTARLKSIRADTMGDDTRGRSGSRTAVVNVDISGNAAFNGANADAMFDIGPLNSSNP